MVMHPRINTSIVRTLILVIQKLKCLYHLLITGPSFYGHLHMVTSDMLFIVICAASIISLQ